MDFTPQNCRVRLRVKNEGLTRDKVIETVFITAEIPFVRVFGSFPIYTALTTEKNGNKLLKQEIKNKLKLKGIEVQIPMEMKARRTIFMRRLDKHVGEHTKEEIKEEIEKKSGMGSGGNCHKNQGVHSCTKSRVRVCGGCGHCVGKGSAHVPHDGHTRSDVQRRIF